MATRRRKRSRLENVIKISVALVIVFTAVIVVFGILSYSYVLRDLPSIESLKNYRPPTITRFFSDSGDVIGEFSVEKREVVSLDRIPNHLIQAFVAGEDARFFHHKGLDYLAILRALYRNIFSGEIVQGGSTISQQVVKSLLLSPEKSFARKAREAILAFRIETYLTKEEILHLYLNQIYFGHGAYGVATAAETYFGKPVDALTLAESALLAGLPQAPSKYSPYNHPDQAKRRQVYILNRMLEEGWITYGDFLRSSQAILQIREKPTPSVDRGTHFTEHVRKYIEERYGKEGLYKDGLRVYTTLDLDMQRVAQEALESGLVDIEKRQKHGSKGQAGPLEGSLICFDLESGYVKVMVGGRDFKKSQFNRATQARRQTGSAFKPIVYASALDKGYTPASIIVDAPIVFEWGNKTWKPKNYGEKFYGPITLRNALAQSVNVVTVKIAQDIGTGSIREVARKLGIASPIHENLSMALGSSSLSLYELTRAYSVFASQGMNFKPVFVKRVLDRNGNLLEENLPLFYPRETAGEERSLNPQTAYLMTSLLESAVQSGTGWRARALKRPVAAKTGTTDEFIDAWFIGYTAELATGVWVGFDDERSLGENETGARAASPIWVNFMSKVLKDKPVKDFALPEGIEFMKVDPKTGETGTASATLLECFSEGMVPSRQAPARAKPTTDFFKYDFNLSAQPRQMQ